MEMDSIKELNEYLDNIKANIPNFLQINNKKSLTIIKDYFNKVETDLKQHCVNLQTHIQDEINKGIEIEYEIEPHPLVDSQPYIKLTLDFYDPKTKHNNIDYKCNLPNYSSLGQFIKIFEAHKNKRLFGVPNILTENEYVVYIKFHCPDKKIQYHIGNNYNYYDIITVNITYITNYGRFINSIFDIYSGYDNSYPNIEDINTSSEIVISNNQITYSKYNNYIRGQNLSILSGYPKSIIDATEKPLTYKMPKIFIKILNAIKDENTELLQECLEEYHTRYIENKKLKAENEHILETIKQPYDDIKPKYEILVKEHDELKLEYEKLKHEFELLKIKMEEQRKLYMG
jgi:hypothetical protein